MILFDKLAKIVDKSPELNVLKKIMGEARLFLLNAHAHDVAADKHSEEEVEELRENFMLPFKCVAIEDTASCIIFRDYKKDARGMDVDRAFIEIISGDPNPEGFTRGYNAEWRDKNLFVISMGIMKFAEFNQTDFVINGELKNAMMYDDAAGHITVAGDELIKNPAVIKSALTNAGVVIREIITISRPETFILEEKPEKSKKRARKAKERTMRSYERPIYTILKPHEIRKRMGLPEPEHGGGRRPHERRAHLRTYRSKVYVNMKGKSKFIAASWIGPSTSVHKKKRYKVLLDK